MYQSILIADELRAYLPLLCRFLNGEKGGLKCEKLRHTGANSIYSLRVSQSTRLLYTVANINGEKSAVVIGEVLSHDYHKSRFLRANGVLEQFLEKHREQIAKTLILQAESVAYEPVSELDKDDKAIETVSEPVVQDYYRLKPFGARLFFEDAAQEVIVKNPLAKTVIISGSSGTGKTVSAMLYLSGHAGACRLDGQPKRFLYVSASRFLVDQVRKQMQAALSPEQLACIDFKTYADLVGPAPHLVERTDVEIYIAKGLKKEKHDFSQLGGVAKLNDAIQVVHDEWILLAGLDGDLDAYQKLGDDQSYIKKEHNEVRQHVHSLYQQFQKNLKENEVYLPFHGCKRPENRYDGLIIDEAFLLSFANVLGLSKISEFTMLLGDSHQAIGAHWLSAFTSLQEGGVSHIPLRENHRNPSSVIEILNRVLQIKYHIRPGLRDKYEQGQIINNKTQMDAPVIWIDDNWLKHNQEALLNWKQSTQLAVVMLCDEMRMTFDEIEIKKKNIENRFNTPLVFTRKEIQGLEYPVIIMVIDSSIHFISSKLPRGFANEIHHNGAGPTTRSAEKGVLYAQQQAMDFSSQLYVGCSRAQQQLVIYVDEDAKRQAFDLIEYYKGASQSACMHAIEKKIIQLDSSTDDWDEERKRQESLGNQAIAKRIAEFQKRSTYQKSEQSAAPLATISDPNALTAKHHQLSSPAAMSTPVPLTQQQQVIEENQAFLQAPDVFYKKGWQKTVNAYMDPKKITMLNLKTVCNAAKSSDLLNWVLFGAEVEDGTHESIFLKYLTADKLKIFFEVIQAYIDKLSLAGMYHWTGADVKMSLVYTLCCREEGLDFLQSNSGLFEMLGKVNKQTPAREIFPGEVVTSAIHFLCKRPRGIYFLRSNRHLLTKISVETLNTRLPESAGYLAGGSALLSLSSHREGCALLKDNQNLVSMIIEDTLNTILSKKNLLRGGISAVFALCDTPEGRLLLQANPSLLAKITPQALNARVPETASIDQGKSPVYLLCSSSEGRKLLNTNPDLVAKIDFEVLTAQSVRNTEGNSRKCALDYLKDDENGLEVLKMINSNRQLTRIENCGNAFFKQPHADCVSNNNDTSSQEEMSSNVQHRT